MSGQLPSPQPIPKTKRWFRCYVEINDITHRLEFQDIIGKQFVRFRKVLSKLIQIDDGLKDIDFNSHSFKHYNERGVTTWIRSSRFQVYNASKIQVSTKTAGQGISQTATASAPVDATKPLPKDVVSDRKQMHLCLVQKLGRQLGGGQRATQIDWQSVVTALKADGHRLFTEKQLVRHFNTVIAHYLMHMSAKVFKKRLKDRKLDDQKREMFAILDTICFDGLLKYKTVRSINRLRDLAAVKDTVHHLLTQTVATQTEPIDRGLGGGRQRRRNRNQNKAPTKPVAMAPTAQSNRYPIMAVPLVMVSTGMATLNKRTAPEQRPVLSCADKSGAKPAVKANQRPGRRQRKRRSDERFDTALVTAVHDLQTIATNIEWPVVRQTLRSLGFSVPEGDHCLETRIKVLISQYICVMKAWDEVLDAIKAYPHFQCLHYMDLSPFCSQRTHQLIQSLRSKYHTKYDCISIDSQQTSQYYYTKFNQNY